MITGMKQGMAAGFILGAIICSITSAYRICQVRDEGIAAGKAIGACEARGGRMVEGVCAKVEVIK